MTPHIEAKKEDIAKIVIMPGDPLRAKYIAENFLEDAKLVNKVRNIFGYTGNYKGKRVTVMASGMGNASIGIYSYELFKFYDVDYIIRIGTAGSYTEDLNLLDLVLVENSFSKSNFAKEQNGNTSCLISSSNILNNYIRETAKILNFPIKEGTVHCSDVFYSDTLDYKELVEKHNCIAVEMETFALFHNSNILNKNASCILSISDSFIKPEKLAFNERQSGLNQMIKLALESCINIEI